MKAKIFKPSKTAMQSGRAKNKNWVLKFSDQKTQLKDIMMGWNGGSSTLTQIELKFSTKKEAINYARNNKIDYEILESSERKVINKSYADNFK